MNGSRVLFYEAQRLGRSFLGGAYALFDPSNAPNRGFIFVPSLAYILGGLRDIG
jgi:hypothetical protein